MPKRFLPKSLFGRFLLIILVPNILVQVFAVYMFYQRHWRDISQHMAQYLAGDIALAVEYLETDLEKPTHDIINRADQLIGLNVAIGSPMIYAFEMVEYKSSAFKNLNKALRSRIKYDFRIYFLDEEKKKIAVDIAMKEHLVTMSTSVKRLAHSSTYIFVMWMTGSALFFIMVAVMFMRGQVRSIQELADAADAFGKGREIGDFKPRGATEVRKAAHAFIDMKKNIDRQVSQRMEMLAGISHDLKTPLTRMKLQLAIMKSKKEKAAMEEEVVEMEKMVQGFLDFAKGRTKTLTEPVNVADLMRSIVAGYRGHHEKIDLKTPSGIILHINSGALRRVITNIIDNALKYGTHAYIDISATEKYVIFIFDDDGPGIPAKKRDKVFKAFVRLDNARNMNEGGTGLGLAVTKDIVTEYGGTIGLDHSPKGGLRVTVKLPL